MTNRQRQAIETRNHIKTCTTGLIKEQGYDQVTIKDICSRADVSIGTFYHYFQNKEDIINDCYKTFDLHMEEWFQTLQPPAGCEALLALLCEQLRYCQSDGFQILAPVFQMQMGNKEKYILNQDRYFYVKILEQTQTGLDNGELKTSLSAEQIVTKLIRLNRGIVYDWCLRNGEYDLVTVGMEDVRFMLEGICGTRR